MNVESYVQCQVAVSLMPRLNCNVCVPLVERCGRLSDAARLP